MLGDVTNTLLLFTHLPEAGSVLFLRKHLGQTFILILLKPTLGCSGPFGKNLLMNLIMDSRPLLSMRRSFHDVTVCLCL